MSPLQEGVHRAGHIGQVRPHLLSQVRGEQQRPLPRGPAGVRRLTARPQQGRDGASRRSPDLLPQRADRPGRGQDHRGGPRRVQAEGEAGVPGRARVQVRVRQGVVSRGRRPVWCSEAVPVGQAPAVLQVRAVFVRIVR